MPNGGFKLGTSVIGPQAAKSDAWLAFSDHRDGVFACFIFFKPEGGLEKLDGNDGMLQKFSVFWHGFDLVFDLRSLSAEASQEVCIVPHGARGRDTRGVGVGFDLGGGSSI